jgi:hypothetical protein
MNTMSKPNSDRLLGCLLGGIVGMLFICCLGTGAVVLFQGSDTATAPPSQPPPQDYDIEAIVEEYYINRIMLDSPVDAPSPLPMVGGELNLHPGGQAEFAVQMEVGPLRPVFRGVLEFRATPAGEIEIAIVEAHVGYIPVTPLIPPGQLDAVNLAINKMLIERAAATGTTLQVVGVHTDETRLRFYFVARQ